MNTAARSGGCVRSFLGIARGDVLGVVLVCIVAGTLGGCLERTVTVTSDPPGAVAWVNDVEIGRTPATAAFEFYGMYEVRLVADGYEPLTVGKTAVAPFYEYAPFDLVATAIPARIRTERVWRFVLEPSPTDPAALLERARTMRTTLGAPKP